MAYDREHTNLLVETLAVFEYNNLDPRTVIWVGSFNGSMAIAWDAFKIIAENTVYDSDYGSQEIAEDLVIVFDNGSWLERHEYDGREHWAYCKVPVRNPDSKSFQRVKKLDDEWQISLETINNPPAEEE